MKNYAKESLIKCNHVAPNKPCHSPHANKLLTHGAKIQCADAPDVSPVLNKVDTKKIQAILGSLLHYTRVVENKILVPLSIFQ